MANNHLQPTWYGHVATTRDALLLFEACLNGTLHHVPRRPHDRERPDLIQSGSVFIYEENASGIKRWTDGVPWSPSRILGNFLVYRELIKPFPPGEKKRATRRTNRPSRPGEAYADSEPPASPDTPTAQSSSTDRESADRALIGSLIDSYGFREGGLVKKTMSVNVYGVYHHLVSYYKVSDAQDGTLKPPSQDRGLMHILPRPELQRQSFRAGLDDAMGDIGDPRDATYHYSYSQVGYDNRRPSVQTTPGGQPYQPNSAGYGGMPYPNGPQMQHRGSFGNAAPQPGYYGQNHDPYSPTYHGDRMDTRGGPTALSQDRSGSHQPQSPYHYRQDNAHHNMPLSSPTHHQDVANRGSYSNPTSHGNSQVTSPYGPPPPSQWSQNGSSSRQETGWNERSNWPSHNGVPEHRANYQGQSQQS